MPESSEPPRRISMAYVLGFSNKPFKEKPPAPEVPRKPSKMDQLVSNVF